MNNRERTLAILNYRNYDRLPLMHFGYWNETLSKWVAEGHITPEQARTWDDGNSVDDEIATLLGFDFNWLCPSFIVNTRLQPLFETRVLEELPDGSRKKVNRDGVVIIEKDGTSGIPPEVDHLLKGRREWEEHYLPRLQFAPERALVNVQRVRGETGTVPLFRTEKGTVPISAIWTNPVQVHCGSLYGYIRDWVGLVNLAYLQADDPELFDEMIDTLGELSFQCVKRVLEQIPADVELDCGHFWEDICFKNGPLVNPHVFRQKVGPHYRRITELLKGRRVKLVSVDCDGMIDALVPIWLENGVNVMFPIEVGTWNGSIRPWREKYGRELRGVGGMDKRVFACDYAAIDAEIERLKPLVALGGYIPCPDHRLAPDAKWENVQYYCARMRKTFG